MTKQQVAGRNGVALVKRPRADDAAPAYRTYEVHQRERVGESTENIKPIQLVSEEYRQDPYPLLEILRENYPCYRNWQANSYWLTRYNDVTSVFTDDANFETRPKAWYLGVPEYGRDLRFALPVLEAQAARIDGSAEQIASALADALARQGGGNLATEFAAAFAMKQLAHVWGIAAEDEEEFCARYWRMQRGTSWDPHLQLDGVRALRELEQYVESLLARRRASPGEDVLSVLAGLEIDGAPVSAADAVRTLLEGDHETLHGALANLWFLLLTHPGEFEQARSEQRLMKLAYLETLRHSAPVLSAQRFTRHEVERFGKLLPEGALVVCSAAAANRDPRIFKDPDRFIVDRRDMCQREPRGQYRADGLASGIAFGLGKPSVHPAVPEDRPRSLYAITRDTAVTASLALLDALPDIALEKGAEPRLQALTVGEMHICWRLPVVC